MREKIIMSIFFKTERVLNIQTDGVIMISYQLRSLAKFFFSFQAYFSLQFVTATAHSIHANYNKLTRVYSLGLNKKYYYNFLKIIFTSIK